ncbi:helix-turn-helix domain-containing protein, partial [Allochromatium palmeri]|nr:helix-turn-helix domain-containing protein [Allochromatium palmeri]MTW20562.1 helix-turn-helix domain-containing protein [Allochromatium palmeri]MTW23240.1 helix-turn-helix domain-containing protein [Allochromatium palmeri]
MARPAPLIELPPEPRTVLEGLARSRETAHSLVQRAQIVLRAADGER